MLTKVERTLKELEERGFAPKGNRSLVDERDIPVDRVMEVKMRVELLANSVVVKKRRRCWKSCFLRRRSDQGPVSDVAASVANDLGSGVLVVHNGIDEGMLPVRPGILRLARVKRSLSALEEQYDQLRRTKWPEQSAVDQRDHKRLPVLDYGAARAWSGFPSHSAERSQEIAEVPADLQPSDTPILSTEGFREDNQQCQTRDCVSDQVVRPAHLRRSRSLEASHGPFELDGTEARRQDSCIGGAGTVQHLSLVQHEIKDHIYGLDGTQIRPQNSLAGLAVIDEGDASSEPATSDDSDYFQDYLLNGGVAYTTDDTHVPVANDTTNHSTQEDVQISDDSTQAQEAVVASLTEKLHREKRILDDISTQATSQRLRFQEYILSCPEDLLILGSGSMWVLKREPVGIVEQRIVAYTRLFKQGIDQARSGESRMERRVEWLGYQLEIERNILERSKKRRGSEGIVR